MSDEIPILGVIDTVGDNSGVTSNDGTLRSPILDANGMLYAKLMGLKGVAPSTVSISDPTADIINPVNTLDASIFNYVFDQGAAGWARLRAASSAGAPLTLGLLANGAHRWSNTLANWQPDQSAGVIADAADGNTGFGTSSTMGYNAPALAFDRLRVNQDFIIAASSAHIASFTSPDQLNVNGRGVKVIFDVTIVPGVQTLTLAINGKDPASGKYYPILTSAAILAIDVGNVPYVFTVYPGIAASANVAVSDFLPRTWNITITASGVGSFTYSLAATVIL